MRTDLIRSQVYESKSRLPRPVLIAILIGLGLGSLSTITWSSAPFGVALARWPAGLAIGLLVVALTGRRRLGPGRWDLMLAGQLLATLAVGLFFFAWLGN
jgi:drug/metabolite transporter (DMT)-like permease